MLPAFSSVNLFNSDSLTREALKLRLSNVCTAMPSGTEIVHTDITDVTIVFAVLGFLFVVYGQLSYVVKEHLYLSEPLIAVTLGILVGPYVLSWIEPTSWSSEEGFREITYQFTRLVLGVQVLFTGIDLPAAYLWREARSLTVMLLGMMTVAWFATALLIWGLIRMPAGIASDGIGYSLTFLESLCISAAVTPTDPVLAASITKGRFAEKYVPANVRNIILAESGANDGLGFPFLYLAVYLINRASVDKGDSVGTEIGRWIYAVLIYQVLLSCVYGALLGYLARKTLQWAEKKRYIDRANFHAFGLGLALFTLGTTGLFGSDDILACFVAGNSFTWDDWYRVRSEETPYVQDAIDMLLNVAIFIYIGTIIDWDWYHTASTMDAPFYGGIETWRIVVLGILVLLLRRPPWLIASSHFIPALTNWSETIFAGWFGPMGVGAVFYIEVALRSIPDDGSRTRLRELYSPVVLFCVFSSVLAHGISIPLSRLSPKVVRKTRTWTSERTKTLQSMRSKTLGGLASAGGRGSTMEMEMGDANQATINTNTPVVSQAEAATPIPHVTTPAAAYSAQSSTQPQTETSTRSTPTGSSQNVARFAVDHDDHVTASEAPLETAPKGSRPVSPALQLPLHSTSQ